MPATYEPIASTTLGSDTATVTFSSLGSYTDLRLIVHARATTTDGFHNMLMRFNSDTGSNYSRTALRGASGTASSFRGSNQDSILSTLIDGQSSNTTPSMTITDIFSYGNGNVFKTVLIATANSNVSNDPARYVALWRSTSAITSITLTTDGTNFASGGTFSLFGIKAAA